MRTEAYLFSGVAAFFGVNALGYGWYSGEPAGTAALAVASLMASVIAFFCWAHYRRRGVRAQDRGAATVAEGAGPLEFFPPHSHWPVITAAGFAVCALGVVFGLWLFIIGSGVLAAGACGFVFQYVNRQGAGSVDLTSSSASAPTSGAGGGVSTPSP